VGPVSAQIEVDVPRARAFEALADLALRPAFTDHFVADFHLTRIESVGTGAGARFRFTAGPRDFWVDTTIVEVEAPHVIREHGRGGRGNRVPSTTMWELTEGPGSLTTVHVSYWTESRNPVDRALELLTGSSLAYERSWRRALQRLRSQLESNEPGPRRVAVAGGNRHATGIP
jgi:uncharacterized protein YndB with AHSA1/START domain